MPQKNVSVIVELVDKFTKNAEKLNKNTNKLLKSFKGIKSAVGGMAVAFGTFEFVKKTVKLAEEQEKADLQLSASLGQVGLNVNTLLPQLQQLATNFEMNTSYGNEQVQMMEALFIRYGVAPNKLKPLIQATLDYARVTGKDVRSATMDMAKALQGNVSMLQRYGIHIDKATVKTQGLDTIIKAVEKRMGGSESAYMDTFAGKVKQLNNLFGDLLKNLGLTLIKNDGMLKALNSLKKAFIEINNKMQDASSGTYQFMTTIGELISEITEGAPVVLDVIGNVVNTVHKIVKSIVVYISDNLAFLFNVFDLLIHGKFKAALTLVKNNISYVKQDLEEIWKPTNAVSKAIDNVATSTKKLGTVAKNVHTNTYKSSQTLKEFSVNANTASENAEKLFGTMQNVMPTEVWTITFEKLNEALKEMGTTEEELIKKGEIDKLFDLLEKYGDKTTFTPDPEAVAKQMDMWQRMLSNYESYINRATGLTDQLSDAFLRMMNLQKVNWENMIQSMWNSLKAFIAKALAKLVVFELINAQESYGMTGAGFDLGQMLNAIFAVPAFAEGGFVSSPTLALVGEKEPEYIIPQSKMNFQVNVYNATPDTYVKIFSNLSAGSKVRIKEALL